MIDLPIEKFKFLASLNYAIYRLGFQFDEPHTMREIMRVTGYSEPQLRSMKPWLIENRILKPSGKRRSDRIGGGRTWVETFTISRATMAHFIMTEWETSTLYELAHEWINRHDINEDRKADLKK